MKTKHTNSRAETIPRVETIIKKRNKLIAIRDAYEARINALSRQIDEEKEKMTQARRAFHRRAKDEIRARILVGFLVEGKSIKTLSSEFNRSQGIIRQHIRSECLSRNLEGYTSGDDYAPTLKWLLANKDFFIS